MTQNTPTCRFPAPHKFKSYVMFDLNMKKKERTRNHSILAHRPGCTFRVCTGCVQANFAVLIMIR